MIKSKSEIEALISSLSSQEAEELLRKFNRQAKPKKSRPVKFPAASTVSINVNNFAHQVVSKDDVVKHFLEELLPDLDKRPMHEVKAQIVSMYEMLANLEEDKVDRDYWRRKASKILMIDNQRMLFSYVVSMTTGIWM